MLIANPLKYITICRCGKKFYHSSDLDNNEDYKDMIEHLKNCKGKYEK